MDFRRAKYCGSDRPTGAGDVLDGKPMMITRMLGCSRITIQHPYIGIRPRHDRIGSEYKPVAGGLTCAAIENLMESAVVASVAMENVTMESAAIEPRCLDGA
jgi:hypothetical protein